MTSPTTFANFGPARSTHPRDLFCLACRISRKGMMGRYGTMEAKPHTAPLRARINSTRSMLLCRCAKPRPVNKPDRRTVAVDEPPFK